MTVRSTTIGARYATARNPKHTAGPAKPISSPATDGPTIRVALIAAAPRATALTTRWRSTRSATSACRVGRSAASVAPNTIATTRMAAKLAWPVATRTASDPALSPRSDCVTSRIRRRGRRSASTPPASERITDGIPSAAATAATAVVLPVLW